MRFNSNSCLKSNMDRFTDEYLNTDSAYVNNLKSNMDRFIVLKLFLTMLYIMHLKSNMDRFIDKTAVLIKIKFSLFKIQYG